jgi:hypothetical protein
MDRLYAYCEGGDDFPVKTELRWKQIERSGHACAGPMRQVREQCAEYTDYLGDTIADLVSTICMNPLCIEDDQSRPYWSKLADNINGRFGSATSEARAALTNDFLYPQGAFYLVKFPYVETEGSGLAAQIAAGAADGQIIALDTRLVTNWKTKSDGSLESATTSEMELVGADYEIERYTWTIYGIDSIAVYNAEKPVSQQKWEGQNLDGSFNGPGPNASLNVDESGLHDFKRCPVFKVNRPLKTQVGKKLLPTAHKLFNAEADKSFYEFTTITGGLFIYTDTPEKFEKGVVLTPFGAVVMGTTDKIDRDKCDPATLAALGNECAELRSQLGGLIHNMARQSAQQSASGQNTSRNTGAALKAQKDPMNAWLCGFSEGHLACFREMIQGIADYRDDDVSTLEVCGLMPIDDKDDEPPVMAEATAFFALPYVPEIAKEEYGRAVGYDMCEAAGVESETLEKVKSAPAEKKPEPIAPIPVTVNNGNPAIIKPPESENELSNIYKTEVSR